LVVGAGPGAGPGRSDGLLGPAPPLRPGRFGGRGGIASQEGDDGVAPH